MVSDWIFTGRLYAMSTSISHVHVTYGIGVEKEQQEFPIKGKPPISLDPGTVRFLEDGRDLHIFVSEAPDHATAPTKYMLQDEKGKTLTEITYDAAHPDHEDTLFLQRLATPKSVATHTRKILYFYLQLKAKYWPPVPPTPSPSTPSPPNTPSELDQFFGSFSHPHPRSMTLHVYEGKSQPDPGTLPELDPHVFGLFQDLYKQCPESTDPDFSKCYLDWFRAHRSDLVSWVENIEPLPRLNRTIPAYLRYKEYPAGAKVITVGDLHGGFRVLFRMVQHWVKTGYMQKDGVLSDNVYALFLGDLIDQHKPNYAVLALVGVLQMKNPDRVDVICGTQEANPVDMDEELGKLGIADPAQHRITHIPWFQNLPAAVFLRFAQDPYYIYCAHGMLPMMQTSSPPEVMYWPRDEKEDFTDACRSGDVAGAVTLREIQQYCAEYQVKFIVRGHQGECSTRIGVNQADCHEVAHRVCYQEIAADRDCVQKQPIPAEPPSPTSTEDTFLVTTSSAKPVDGSSKRDYVYVVMEDRIFMTLGGARISRRRRTRTHRKRRSSKARR